MAFVAASEPHEGILPGVGAFDTRPVVHSELIRGSVFLDQPEDVNPYIDATASLEAVALNADQSARFVADVLAEYE